MKLVIQIIKGLRLLNRGIEGAFKPIGALLVILMLTTVAWTVIARETGITASWTDKVMLILLPTLAFIIAPIAYRRSANVSLDLFKDMLPMRIQSLHSFFVHLIIFVILMVSFDLTLRKIGFNPYALSASIEWVTGMDLSAIRPFRVPIKIPVLNIEWRTVFTIMPIAVFATILVNIEFLLRDGLRFIYPNSNNPQNVKSLDEILDMAAGE